MPEDNKNTLKHEFDLVWDKLDESETEKCFMFSEAYKKFLNNSKTERACFKEIKSMAIAAGYESIQKFIDGSIQLTEGAKVYAENRNKAIILWQIGKRPVKEGIHIVGAHIDAPRLDLKPFPLYEDADMAFLKTHYYGGVKKYQWATTQLALHGFVVTKSNETVEIVIGEDESDPIFVITDLLIHLSQDQLKKTMAEGITGESLNVLMGNMPYGDKAAKERVKYQMLTLLHEKYGIDESDFLTAEFEIVPAGKARDLGLDRSMISGYGHDDRVCSYTGLRALLDIDSVEVTACGVFMDKEEVGNNGNTGAESKFFENMFAELIALQEKTYSDLYLRRALTNTKVLSGDVGAAFDPNYASAYEKNNSPKLGKGVQLAKYSGSRGKSGCNDANAEFLHEIRSIFDANEVVWQIGELGKIDQGGGGTIAHVMANTNAEVVDCGVPVLSMHSTNEVVSKADVYMTYKAYHAFLNR